MVSRGATSLRAGPPLSYGVQAICEVAVKREQFIEADRRVRRYLCLILFLTACAAIGLGFALPAWAEAVSTATSSWAAGSSRRRSS